jgi:hypothetical protein
MGVKVGQQVVSVNDFQPWKGYCLFWLHV